jgi:hypothetical protein
VVICFGEEVLPHCGGHSVEHDRSMLMGLKEEEGGELSREESADSGDLVIGLALEWMIDVTGDSPLRQPLTHDNIISISLPYDDVAQNLFCPYFTPNHDFIRIFNVPL